MDDRLHESWSRAKQSSNQIGDKSRVKPAELGCDVYNDVYNQVQKPFCPKKHRETQWKCSQSVVPCWGALAPVLASCLAR